MDIDVKFYTDIFDKELYWTDLASKNLLNIYYINGTDGLKDFYIEKLNILSNINKPKIKFIIDMINEILDEINVLTDTYNSGKDININNLVSLFIINQITNKKSN